MNARNEREAHLERAMYMAWLHTSGETNTAQLKHLQNCISIAIQECLTERQRQILEFYMGGYSQKEIAEELGVNRATISKTLNRAMKNLFSHVKYATPATLHAEDRARRYLTRLYT